MQLSPPTLRPVVGPRSAQNPPRKIFLLSLATALVCAVFGVGSAQAASNSIGVTAPQPGDTLSKTATFSARLDARLAGRTSRVEVWVTGRRVAVDRTAPFVATVDTTQLTDGNYNFHVKAIVRPRRGAQTTRARIFARVVPARVSNGRVKKPTTPIAPTAPTTTTPPVTTTPPPTTTTPPATSPLVDDIKAPGSTWTQTFGDEFDGTALDKTKWNDQRNDWLTGGIPYNNLEGAWYNPANNSVSGGSLHQTVRKQASNGMSYTTGMVNSNKKISFKYGYVESRMKVPACDGCWPAYWMLPSAVGWPPEIDIYEFFDSDTDHHPYFSSHWKSTTADQEYTSQWAANGDYTDAWHTYGMLWTPDSVRVFVDGVQGPVYTGNAVPHEAMYLILALQTGKGYNTPDGATLDTDYIRIWQNSAS